MLIALLVMGCGSNEEASFIADPEVSDAAVTDRRSDRSESPERTDAGPVDDTMDDANTDAQGDGDALEVADTEDAADKDTEEAEPEGTAEFITECVTPTEADLLYPPYPAVPQDCLQDMMGCPFEPGYGAVNPTATCNITAGYDEDGTLQARFWEIYESAQAYFGAFGPVYIYFMGPTDVASNQLIWELRAQRRAIVDACYPVEQQVYAFLNQNQQGVAELEAANTGDQVFAGISDNGGCQPLMDFTAINLRLDDLPGITWHEYNHIFQISHFGTNDRSSDFGPSSWIMEGQATYSTAKFGEIAGWGDSFESAMMAMKAYGGNISPIGIDAFLADEDTFDFEDESYWERDDFAAPAIYYMLGAWAWAYLVHEVGGDYDIALKDFIVDIAELGKAASFEKHFGRTLDEFYAEFALFIQGDDDAWRAILD